ncbi:MAG TPA: putative toxin-antitoxin system toxin component, PIN family [Dongiaceae bacterium]|jgi:putative PIN family toxin of toxin-antitoxin system|nr:putative toxin-antitoxin system toxin component, PIN family [Dongiaceae bacterium]
MTGERRVVIDTNTYVSRLLIPGSAPARAVDKVLNDAVPLLSDATLEELADVLSRRKFDRYVTLEERKTFIHLLASVAALVPIVQRIQACRDPKDDKFLELALNGEADLIITGDKDLMALDPFHGVRIMTPARYLEG